VKYSTVEQEILAKLPLEVLLAMLLANWPPPSSLKARSGPRFSIGDCLFAPVPWKREVWGLPHMQRLLKIAEANRLARLGEFCFQLVVFVSQADAPVDSGVRKLDQTELGNMLSRCRPTISRFITRPLRRGKEPRQYYEEAGRAWRLFYSAGKDEIVPTLRGIWYDVDKAWATYKAQRAVLPKTTPPPPT
jgi:hypothetical protein